ncbi:MAG: TMEM165/GDT1 family protein [Desertifilum sp.]|nr:TMEM165/GDT1 family protein [Desertifilum sp.]
MNSPFPASNQSDRPTTQPRGQGSGFQVFVSTFVTIFLAELGDKTQLTTLLMSAESESPWVVFMGAACALIATSLIGVLLGRWLSRRLSPQVLETASGAILLGISVLLLWDVVNL